MCKTRSCGSLKTQSGKLSRSLLPRLLVKANHRASPDSRGGRTMAFYGWSSAHRHGDKELMVAIFGVSLPQWVLYFFTQMGILRLKNITCPRPHI